MMEIPAAVREENAIDLIPHSNTLHTKERHESFTHVFRLPALVQDRILTITPIDRMASYSLRE